MAGTPAARGCGAGLFEAVLALLAAVVRHLCLKVLLLEHHHGQHSVLMAEAGDLTLHGSASARLCHAPQQAHVLGVNPTYGTHAKKGQFSDYLSSYGMFTKQ